MINHWLLPSLVPIQKSFDKLDSLDQPSFQLSMALYVYVRFECSRYSCLVSLAVSVPIINLLNTAWFCLYIYTNINNTPHFNKLMFKCNYIRMIVSKGRGMPFPFNLELSFSSSSLFINIKGISVITHQVITTGH